MRWIQIGSSASELAFAGGIGALQKRNVINDPLVDKDRILFPLLHIKLGLIKQFTKALDKDGDFFTYLC